MRILIADDQPQVRSAIQLLLNQHDDSMAVIEAGSMTETLEQILNVRPDLVLLDWELPGFDATNALRQLHLLRPDMVVIALSSRPEAHLAALTSGAHAFVSKGDPPEYLLETVARFHSPPSHQGSAV
ncbi:MAG: response regulator transcription factor [Anaerolineae bacterium]|nr:response regulator transcription factor [Anaerolineae bacterium]